MNPSPLLELLSHTAMKGTAVLLVALLLGLTLRRMAAARRYALWITTIAALGVLPLAMLALPAWRVLPQTTTTLEGPKLKSEPVSESFEPLAAESVENGPLVAVKAPPQVLAPIKSRRAMSWQDVVANLPLLWAIGACCLLLRLGWCAWRLRRLEATLRPGECAMLSEAARLLGLRRMPHLLIGPRDAVPMVWGVLNPRLLLPEGFATWSTEKQRGVLLHELAHLKRGDPLALWAAQWVKALHWFNPLAWLTLRQLRADQERACDDTVLRHGLRASDYAQALLDLSRHQRLAPGLSLCALTITRCAPVEARVKAILDPKRHREGLTLRWLAGLTACALLITLPVAMLHAIEGTALRGRILDRHGRVLAESTKEKSRNYPLKTLGGHMVGYVGQTKAHAGMEKQHDAELAAGKDVTLTLDMRLQSLALRAMTEAGVTRGAAVVLDPRSGEVLAAVSLPSYDPNQFVPSIDFESWDALLRNAEAPMLDRCFKGIAPGSTFKLLTGLAGGAAGIRAQKFNCTGSVTYGSKSMECWIQPQNGGRHAMLGMAESLAVSCNCYWYQFGNLAGIDEIESMGRTIGFGSAYGISDEEDKGLLPSPAWLKQFRPGEKWTAAHTANTSIGQGFVQATPLQMAVLAATVGNIGKIPQPGIVKQQEPRAWHADLTQGTLTAADVEPLREGMRLAVNDDSGTGRRARSDKVVIAGKTGTTQNWRRDAKGTRVEDNNGWFIGFAPYDRPQLAFAIIKNGAKSGGGDCGPIAKRIVEEALALPADGSGEVQPVEEPITPEKQAQNQFDAKADAIKAAIERIKPDATTGFKLDEITVRRGQVLVSGSASGMIQALQFRDALTSLKWEDELEWTFPVPQTLSDGKRVGFRIVGVLASKTKNATTLEEVQAALVSLNDQRSNVWDAVRKTAGLAEIPNGRVALRGEVGDPAIHFHLLQKEAIGWLRDSLGAQMDVGWLESADMKIQTYTAKGGYEIEVEQGKVPTVFKVTVKAARKKTAAASASQVQIHQQSDAAIRMRPEQARSWAALKRAGLLADLPAKASPFDLGEPEGRQMKSVLTFRFSAPREEVRRWLLDSHCAASAPVDLVAQQTLLPLGSYIAFFVKENALPDWPAAPEAFQRNYAAAGRCMILVHTPDGENVSVIISQAKPHILIAPDEAAPPKPKTASPKELEGVVSAEDKPMPALDASMNTLRSTVSPDEEKRLQPALVFFARAKLINVQPPAPEVLPPAPLQHLADILSEESARELSRSSQSRRSLALIVKTPQPH